MRGKHGLGIAIAAWLALACSSAPASPSLSPSLAPTTSQTPDTTAGAPTPTPRPASQQVPGELTVVWETTGCTASDVAPTFELRLVMVGFCRSQSGFRSVAWETDTAFEWRRVFETGEDVNLWTASTDGRDGGALIGGWDASGPQIWRGDIFEGFEQDEPARLPTDTDGGLIRGIEWGDGDYLAVGEQSAASEGAAPAPVVWRYRDTGPWEKIDAPPRAQQLDGVMYGPDPLTYTVIGTTDRATAAVWRLTNGTEWSEPIQLPVGQEEPLVELLDAHTVLGLSALWEEDETGEWHYSPLLSGVSAAAGVLLGDGVVVFGSSPDSNNDPEVAVLAAGADRHWQPLDVDPSDRRKQIHDAVVFDDRVVAAGDAVWMGPDEIEAYLE
jgi:hypothetical protein